MVTIIGGIGTADAKRRFEQIARDGGYHVEEWLVPGSKGLRVAATVRIAGRKHGLGFNWDGEDVNTLVVRCMALDVAMKGLPAKVARGEEALWTEKH